MNTKQRNNNWNRILVHVTIYRRLLIGRDGHLDQSEMLLYFLNAFVLYFFIYLIRHAIVVFLIVFCPVLRYNMYGIVIRFSA